MAPDNAPPSDTAEPERALVTSLDYPMFVVTATGPEGPSGCLAGFVTQCSIDPVRFLACVSKENHTFGVASAAESLAIHLLGRDQVATASHFGERTGDRTDKFAGVAWAPGPHGAPVLAECAAWVEGPVLASHDLGDHQGFVVGVGAGGAGPAAPQLTFKALPPLDPGHPA